MYRYIYISHIYVCVYKYIFWGVGLGFKLRLWACKAGALSLELHLQSILLWLFWRWGGLTNCLPALALNCNPLYFSLPSN
jgi:hypothetical protein